MQTSFRTSRRTRIFVARSDVVHTCTTTHCTAHCSPTYMHHRPLQHVCKPKGAAGNNGTAQHGVAFQALRTVPVYLRCTPTVSLASMVLFTKPASRLFSCIFQFCLRWCVQICFSEGDLHLFRLAGADLDNADPKFTIKVCWLPRHCKQIHAHIR